MTYRQNYSRRSGTAAPRARWMDLRYAGTCAQCSADLPAGTRAFYDPADRTVCCLEMACCDAHGLTREKWTGSPLSGQWTTVRSETRIGQVAR